MWDISTVNLSRGAGGPIWSQELILGKLWALGPDVTDMGGSWEPLTQWLHGDVDQAARCMGPEYGRC